MNRRHALVAVLFTAASTFGEAQEWTSLFNGRDLTGWQRVNTDERTWSVKDGMLICSGRWVCTGLPTFSR